MFTKVISVATVGLESVPVTVEIDIASGGLPSFTIVGLPSKSIEESKERVRAAIKNSGADFPARRITINLAPANLPKEGPAYDLPIAVGILLASGQMTDIFNKAILFGELSLDGSLRHTNGILPATILAKEKKFTDLYIPLIDTKEAAVINGVKIFGITSLLTLFLHSQGKEIIQPVKHIPFNKISEEGTYETDFSDIRGQQQAKRAMIIACAGGHNIHLKGLPGAGKTMLARATPSILPSLTEKEALEVTKIYSITGNIPAGESIIKHRPFRSPHHTTSRIGLIGGGTKPMPGEISLAHRGILFLDEFPEFPRNVLEALRQPLEDGFVTVSRAAGTITFPSKFILIAASNPCPCGYLGDEKNRCRCDQGQIIKYRKRISGPLTDRIDLNIEIPSVKISQLTNDQETNEEKSINIKREIEKARANQRKRLTKAGIFTNAEMSVKNIKELAKITDEAKLLLKKAVQTLGISARGYFRVIKVGRTIADLAGKDEIQAIHIAEALQYRFREQETY